MMEVIEGRLYKHFKGGIYRVLYIALDQDMNKVVVYQEPFSLQLWVRDYDDFIEVLDKDKYPFANQTHRFELYERK